MPRNNACSELTCFWLRARHACLTDENIPVPVPYASSDIDIVAVRPDSTPMPLSDGVMVGPRLIVETKDEHDWDASGAEFGACLRADVAKMDDTPFIPKGVKGVKFTMLRQQHYEKAVELFGSDDFDRLFVVHALDDKVRRELCPQLAERCRIHWVTLPEIVADLKTWYEAHPRPATIRHSFVGDLLHLLWGFCERSGPREACDL